MVDCVIIGAGAAGLSAALILGRCNRSVVIFDSGSYRNASARIVNGYMTEDGSSLKEFRTASLSDLMKYDIKIIPQQVTGITKDFNGFNVNGINSKALILATGLVDILPEIGNINQFWGKSVFICPICDAYEFKNKKIGVFGSNGFNFALNLTQYSNDIIWFSNKNVVDQSNKIKIIETPVSRLIGNDWRLSGVELIDQNLIPCDALFLSDVKHVQSPLLRKLNLIQNRNDENLTNIPGLFLAGDMKDKIHLAIIAAADGANAAIKVNGFLKG